MKFVLAEIAELFVDGGIKTYAASLHRPIIEQIYNFHEHNKINQTVSEGE